MNSSGVTDNHPSLVTTALCSSMCSAAGFVGAMKGMGLGVQHVISRPIKGVGLAGYSVWESLGESKLSKPKCFMPQAR